MTRKCLKLEIEIQVSSKYFRVVRIEKHGGGAKVVKSKNVEVEILHIHKNAVWKSYISIKTQFDISKKSQKVARVYATGIDLYKSTGQI